MEKTPRVILTIVVAGSFLAAAGFAVYVVNVDFGYGGSSGRSPGVAGAGLIVFVVGCLLALGGIVWAIARWLKGGWR